MKFHTTKPTWSITAIKFIEMWGAGPRQRIYVTGRRGGGGGGVAPDGHRGPSTTTSLTNTLLQPRYSFIQHVRSIILLY